ncbi:hypothetical protein M3Y94_00973500 [Aphelenchoides besseyi]|nr:hypothetical protein M3Y94_00973500 [Aphelenchoides besseyi]KAI6224594.1 hypothetical protein M3Y95_00769400 [Aphelenchoides besseyi]
MPSSSMENRLKQRLMYMENAAARLTATKSELKKNAEIARLDVASAVGHQIACIRAREQQLLTQLCSMVNEKEENLCKQQENLNKAIGACQRSLELLQKNKDEVGQANEVLLKYNAINLRPRENPNVVFDSDPNDCRRAISRLGAILVDNKKQIYDSLPSDGEQCEESALAQKSVTQLYWLPMKRQCTEVTLLPEESETDHCASLTDDEFEVINVNGSYSARDSSVSSMETNQTVAEPEHSYIQQVLDSSNSKWLAAPKTPVAAKPQVQTPTHAQQMAEFKPQTSMNVTSIEKKPKYEFERVIDSIRMSSNRRWLAEYQPTNRNAVDNMANALGSCLSVQNSNEHSDAHKPTIMHHVG